MTPVPSGPPVPSAEAVPWPYSAAAASASMSVGQTAIAANPIHPHRAEDPAEPAVHRTTAAHQAWPHPRSLEAATHPARTAHPRSLQAATHPARTAHPRARPARCHSTPAMGLPASEPASAARHGCRLRGPACRAGLEVAHLRSPHAAVTDPACRSTPTAHRHSPRYQVRHPAPRDEPAVPCRAWPRLRASASACAQNASAHRDGSWDSCRRAFEPIGHGPGAWSSRPRSANAQTDASTGARSSVAKAQIDASTGTRSSVRRSAGHRTCR
jgi:hypothetical protein